MSIPRWYQAEAIGSVLLSWMECQRVLLNSPTGSGKNFMAAKIIQAVYPKRSLFLGDADELVFQPADAISRFAGIIPAIEKASSRASFMAKVVVGSVQTMGKKNRLERFPSDFFDYILCDEAHRLVDAKERIFNHFSRAKVCGLTATAFRATMRDLSKWYEEVAFHLPLMDLIAEGFAPPLSVMTVPLKIDLSNVGCKKQFGETDYNAEETATTIAPYYEEAARLIKEHASNRSTIVFLPLIRSSEAFAAIARRVGLSAVHVDGSSPDREELIERFRRGHFQMICNSDVLSTGVDIVNADCIVNLSPIRSLVKYQQRVGRGMRVLPGVIDDIPGKNQSAERRARIAQSAKPECLLIDFLWQHAKLSVLGPESLIAQNENEALGIAEKIKAQRTPEQLAEIAKLFQEEREALLVKQLEAVASRTGTCEPAMFGYLIGSKSLMDYEPATNWEAEPPTEKQLAKLGQWGIDTAKIKCKGEASKLMNAMIHRFKFRLATLGKLQALQAAGIPFDPLRLTDREALRLITQHKLSYAHDQTKQAA